MADATTGALSPETRDRLIAASATGRLVLGMLAGWIDREAAPAVAAVNADLRGRSDDDTAAVARSIPGRDDPAVLADAMGTILDALGRVEGLTAEDRRLVRRLAGEWAPGRRLSR